MPLRKTLITSVISLATLLVPTAIFGQGYGKVEVDTLNVRTEPSVNAGTLGQLSKSDKIEIVEREDELWLEVLMSNGESGYVYAEYISIAEVKGEITGTGVRLRDYPDVNKSQVFDSLSKGDQVVVEYVVGDWCKVTAKGKTGFVSKEFVTSSFMNEVPTKNLSEVERVKESVVAQSTSDKKEASNTKDQQATSLGDAIVQDAMQFLGGRYVYGGNDLNTGVDCSGFTQQIMKRNGISLSRSSRSQYSSDGYKVSKEDVQKGDLLFYGYNGTITHVGIYIGDGKIIHASTSKTGIIISSAFNSGTPYIGAKRVI